MTFTVTRQRAQEVHDLARARAGLPYAYGDAFTRDPSRSTDCSGLVLQTGAWYGGRSDWPGNRYGSTESFRLDHKIVYDLGFKRMPPGGPDALPFRPVMLVGLQHGGGGIYSHTASTLMTMDKPGGPVVQSVRGVDWESRGGNPGVFLYDGARAWNDPLFHDFWYLDAKLEDAVTQPVPVPLSRTDRYALAVIRAGQKRLISRKGICIALTVPPVETDWRNLANAGDPETKALPNDGVGADHDSAGLFQQRRAWGPAAVRMDPEASAGLFYDGGAGGQRGLRAFKYDTDYQSPGTFAADVQQPAAQYRYRYQQHWDAANALYDRLATTATPDPRDPLEELLMSDLEVESLSIYATPGEPKIPLARMVQNIDAALHRDAIVEPDAELGDPDALMRMLRTARGGGKFGAPGPVNHAKAKLAQLAGKSSPVLLYLAQAAADGDGTAREILGRIDAHALTAFLDTLKGN